MQLKVPSMVCEACAQAVTQAVQSVDAGAKVSIDLASKAVTVESAASLEAVQQAIAEAGHEVASAAS